MDIDRRRLIAISALSGAVPVATLATPAVAAPLATLGVDATTLGVRAGGGAEQTNMLQAAIDQTAARARAAGARPRRISRPARSSCRPARSSSACAARRRLIFTGGAGR